MGSLRPPAKPSGIFTISNAFDCGVVTAHHVVKTVIKILKKKEEKKLLIGLLSMHPLWQHECVHVCVACKLTLQIHNAPICWQPSQFLQSPQRHLRYSSPSPSPHDISRDPSCSSCTFTWVTKDRSLQRGFATTAGWRRVGVGAANGLRPAEVMSWLKLALHVASGLVISVCVCV